MQASQTPTLVPLAFAANGTKNTIPEASQIGITPGAASLNDGFPPLTFTPVAAGGVPPAGADFNGVLNLITASIRWAHGGGRYAFSSSFSSDANVSGYPQGAQLMSADLQGTWLSLNDSNTDNPDTGAGTKWVPTHSYGTTAITGLTNANVTLTPAQAAKAKITLAGTLTGNVQLILPTWIKDWVVTNNTTGAFTATCKTSAGTGVAIPQNGSPTKIVGDGTNITQPVENVPSATQGQNAAQLGQSFPTVSASVASNALTVGLTGPTALPFRNPTLNSGAPVFGSIPASLSLTVPSGATLGTVSGQAARIALLVAYNGGTPALCIANLAGGLNLDETTLISATAISGSSNSASTIYSASAIASSPFRVVGFIDITEAAAGTWATAPTTVQGVGGQALAALGSLGYGQTWQSFTSGQRSLATTYYNTTGRPIEVHVCAQSSVTNNGTQIVVNGVTITGSTSAPASVICAVDAIVPPGGSYIATMPAGGATFVSWAELR